ncbi:MAG TPA: thioredoxin family protein [Thermoanaerobaculia bacterium]|nr:thioredoxin family protein [Thermoanaerobaculia bacterium]
MSKRKIEVFTAGCAVCEQVVQAVRAAACDSCQVEVRSTQESAHAEAAARYGIKRLPAVVINGQLADCCGGECDIDRMRALGLGQPA